MARTLAEVDLAEVGVRVGLVKVGDGRDDARAEDLHGGHVLEGDACCLVFYIIIIQGG